MSEILDEAKAHYGGLKGVRWLASRNRALVALQAHYAVTGTITHLENTSTGKKKMELKQREFVKYLHFMIDVKSVLSLMPSMGLFVELKDPSQN